ncbi:MAG: hypothetical protein GWN71_42905, partial [Gammaproteobacteria bacterium]|nr:hypothetical protein [Gemmatimonadota bacterium]NIU80045.1 hypothetical protein [Gammaproteobacteria bacterium]NIX25516.1 hypothetical protein [Actinomycetota bacterium]
VPRTPGEAALLEIWSDALGRTSLGVDDDLFELGAHSLLAARVAARAREIFRVELPLRTLFEATTVARQAAAVDAL